MVVGVRGDIRGKLIKISLVLWGWEEILGEN
jgi:hypothetical protein